MGTIPLYNALKPRVEDFLNASAIPEYSRGALILTLLVIIDSASFQSTICSFVNIKRVCISLANSTFSNITCKPCHTQLRVLNQSKRFSSNQPFFQRFIHKPRWNITFLFSFGWDKKQNFIIQEEGCMHLSVDPPQWKYEWNIWWINKG